MDHDLRLECLKLAVEKAAAGYILAEAARYWAFVSLGQLPEGDECNLQQSGDILSE